MKATEAMIAAGGAKLSEFENVEYTDARPAPTYDALAQQLYDVMMAAREPDADDGAPMVDPFDWSEAGLGKLEGNKLASGLRDNLLDVLRTMPNVWQKLNEEQQRRLGQRCSEYAQRVIYQTAHEVAGLGNTSMGALLKEVKFGDKGIDVKLVAVEASGDASLSHVLVDFQGKNIVIVFVDPATFDEQRTEMVVDPVQPDLPMGEKHPAQAPVDVVAAGEVEKPLIDPEPVYPEVVDVTPPAAKTGKKGAAVH